MEIRHYHLTARDWRWLKKTPPEGDDILVWHDIRMEESQEELQRLGAYLHGLHVDAEVSAACTVPVNFPDVDVSGGCVFVRFPLRMQWNSPKASYVMMLCMKGMLVSISSPQIQLLDRALARLENGSELSEPSSQALLLFIMDACTDMSTRQYMTARAAVEALADRIYDDPDNIGQDELIAIRRCVGRLYSQFEDQLYCMSVLQSLQTQSVPFSHLKAELRDIMDSQNHLVRSQDQLEIRLRDLHNDCLLHAQRKTDYRLRVLTVLTSLCMPLSVIAGIYGMNFRFMPELEWKYGYFVVLGVMGVITVSLLAFFFRRGWFK
ncbi:magnesium transporter CorA family protein [uncultured Mailhella sp.]|uniref:magnesium transporter CorA family protein n=1 Tax=uncultured Mailhella sp. TaxID=1981031 RepID=UPI0025F7BAB7|nr:magnesium transporter CorA family protein [uncultured Mailhella sp.]